MELQKLIHQLQDEKCPPSILHSVTERISREKAAVRCVRFSLAWAILIACLLVAVGFWQWQARQVAQLRVAELAAQVQAQADRAVVVQQTKVAFAYIGQALLSATAHTEKTLSRETMPLRDYFETVKNKVTKSI